MAKNENTQNADHVWLLKYAKILFGRGLVGVWKGHWSAFGRLDVSWMCLGHSWAHLGASGRVLEPSWGHLGAYRERLRRVMGSLGGVLGTFWEDFQRIFCHLEQHVKIAKNLGKPMVFH